MLATNYTIHTIYAHQESGFQMVLIGEDSEGINLVKGLGYSNDTHTVYAIAAALEAVNGVDYAVRLVSKSEFARKYGKRVARELQV